MMAPLQSESNTSASRIPARLLTTFYALVVFTGFLISFAAYWLGVLFNVIFVLLVLLVVGMGFSRVFGVSLQNLELRFVRRPWDRMFRKYLLQALNQWLFLILAVATLRLAIVPIQFALEEYWLIQGIVWGSAGIVLLLALIPHQRVRLSTNSFFAVGWLFLGVEILRMLSPVSHADPVVLSPPFTGEIYILQGGRSALINHHYPWTAQRHALDMTRTMNGRDVDGDKSLLESYSAYGVELYAPADGEVVKVVNDRPDMPIGETDFNQILGNHIVIDMGGERFILMAHLQEGSVRLSPGDPVRRGEPIARCGNSGNTSQPHLHLQVQSHPDFQAADLRTFPIHFRDVTRIRSGRSAVLAKADVRRNDVLVAGKGASRE